MVIDARTDWESLYRAEFPTLYRALVAVLLDGDRALDALHDAFVEGLRRPPRNENVQGWIYRVAVRKGRRAHRRHEPIPADLAVPADVEATLDRLEVRALLGYLTVRQRSVVVARYYLGMRHEEIATLLGIRTGTVGATLSQAMAKMRKEATQDV
jgi:RNA polymerase sigma factor (sigma-70 family)